MDAEQILELMVQASKQMTLPSNEDLAILWARRLATLSAKLTEDDLFPLIALAAMVCQRRNREFEGGVTADLLMKTLREALARKRTRRAGLAH
jgi:hypothetical protein